MRLINVETFQLEEFFDETTPKYAILSHTWGEGEVSFDDWQKPAVAAGMKGYGKIAGTCEFVSKLGDVQYVWIDTVCIDKRSSADLSEAINSMFHWYGNSQVCLVHLSDMDNPAEVVEISAREAMTNDAHVDVLSSEERNRFRASRWFTRGWTLQELLAPERMLFLSKDWALLGGLHGLVEHVEAATGIPATFIRHQRRLNTASIAQRMSWAAGRQTTRIEDMAYCLMGLFGINMPLLYGEGRRAFQRLQAEIIRQSHDHSIFAWSGDMARIPRHPILSPSPECFRGQSSIGQVKDHNERNHYTLTNSGLRITLPLLKTVTPGLILAVLNCCPRALSLTNRICLVLYGTSGDRYTRLGSIPTRLVSVAGVLPEARKKMYIASPDSLEKGDMSGRAAFSMLWSPAAAMPEEQEEHQPPSLALLAFEGGPDQEVPRYLEPRLSWRRLPCPWTRPGLLELFPAGPSSSTHAAILEFSDPETGRKQCVLVGNRPREGSERSHDGRSTWFTFLLERSPRAGETFEQVLEWAAAAGEPGTAEVMSPARRPGQKTYAEISFPKWAADMHWVPQACPVIIMRADRIFGRVTRKSTENEGETQLPEV